jgi:hypothetical protein
MLLMLEDVEASRVERQLTLLARLVTKLKKLTSLRRLSVYDLDSPCHFLRPTDETVLKKINIFCKNGYTNFTSSHEKQVALCY